MASHTGVYYAKLNDKGHFQNYLNPITDRRLTYGLKLNTLLSVGELQGKERLVVTHVVNFVPPTQPIKAQWCRGRGGRGGHMMSCQSQNLRTFLETLPNRCTRGSQSGATRLNTLMRTDRYDLCDAVCHHRLLHSFPL